jgi:hypothetical protein
MYLHLTVSLRRRTDIISDPSSVSRRCAQSDFCRVLMLAGAASTGAAAGHAHQDPERRRCAAGTFFERSLNARFLHTFCSKTRFLGPFTSSSQPKAPILPVLSSAAAAEGAGARCAYAATVRRPTHAAAAAAEGEGEAAAGCHAVRQGGAPTPSTREDGAAASAADGGAQGASCRVVLLHPPSLSRVSPSSRFESRRRDLGIGGSHHTGDFDSFTTANRASPRPTLGEDG